MIVDDDVLEKEDLYILDRMKEFISTEGVSRFAAAKQLLILIERAVWIFPFIFHGMPWCQLNWLTRNEGGKVSKQW